MYASIKNMQYIPRPLLTIVASCLIVFGAVFIPSAHAEEGESMRRFHKASPPITSGQGVYIPFEEPWQMDIPFGTAADAYNLTISGSSPVLTTWSEEADDWKTAYTFHWTMDQAPPGNTRLLIVETSDNGQTWYTNGYYYQDQGNGTTHIPQNGNTENLTHIYGVGCKYYAAIVVDSNNGAVSEYSNYLQVCTQDQELTVTYPDVPLEPIKYTFHDHITELSQEGIVSGYQDGYFRPEFPVTRSEMSKFVRRAFGYRVTTSCGISFRDVPASDPFYDDIITLACEGVVNGYEDGRFKGGSAVVRAEAAKFIVEGLKKSGVSLNEANPSDSFTDVPSTYIFHSVILEAKANGIIDGYDDGTYRPDINTSRGAMSKMINIAREKGN
jgi:hypothetical protein